MHSSEDYVFENVTSGVLWHGQKSGKAKPEPFGQRMGSARECLCATKHYSALDGREQSCANQLGRRPGDFVSEHSKVERRVCNTIPSL